MPYSLKPGEVWAQCPRCKKIVYGEEAIEKEFGFRVMSPNTEPIPQSHCRKCRIEELQEKKIYSCSQ